MLKLLGSVCIATAGTLMRYRVIREERRRTELIREAAAALETMDHEIRLNRTPMPRLLRKTGNGRGREVAEFFASVGMRCEEQGMAEAWRGAAEKLSLPPRERQLLAELGNCLQGDEQQVCRGLETAAAALTKSLERRRVTAAEAEKRSTALCFSGAALLIILLI